MTEVSSENNRPANALTAAQIAAFWQEFVYQERQLALMPQQAYVERANEMLAVHAPELAIELEKTDGKLLQRLVISAHGNTEQFENALALVRLAPSIPGYKVQAFRSRSSGSDFSIGMDGFDLSCYDVLVADYDAGGVVGLELAFEKIIPQDLVEHARAMSFIMLDHVLGEWDFAVRVGPVEFVDGFSDNVQGAEPLSVFPAIFDAFMRNDMGRSYAFPKADADPWSAFEVRRRDADAGVAPDLLSLRMSANALATRADLSHFLELRIAFDDNEQLDHARDAQEALANALEPMEKGLLVFSRVEFSGARIAGYYVDDAVAATAQAHALCAQHVPDADVEVTTMFDPSWQEFCALYAAIKPPTDAESE